MSLIGIQECLEGEREVAPGSDQHGTLRLKNLEGYQAAQVRLQRSMSTAGKDLNMEDVGHCLGMIVLNRSLYTISRCLQNINYGLYNWYYEGVSNFHIENVILYVLF